MRKASGIENYNASNNRTVTPMMIKSNKFVANHNVAMMEESNDRSLDSPVRTVGGGHNKF